MKKIFLFALLAMLFQSLSAQIPTNSALPYWVFFTDKQGSTFDPYSYFDAKAIERYRINGADLYDISNYPVSQTYLTQVNTLSQEEIGDSRWLNAVAVMATADQAEAISRLPFVKYLQPIQSDMTLASQEYEAAPTTPQYSSHIEVNGLVMADQLVRQQGELFAQKGINGTGVRVAVFDGGFPSVNTHEAFRHLRESGRILKTWNFCNKKEDVYGWNTHGTMVLSCIAGIRHDSIQLGLATGAEFLLARTEVNSEPFKEEVWWAQAAEWADKNGAQVINSSLGYGKERHFTKDMDGTSYVAKAANMAARKGIVVCNSAGNEGDDRRWKTIITPADADSVLCVGGINAELNEYSHISFSSYGPSADGRLKPNVCNFGYANVASPSGDDKYTWVYGTSFSSPLTAGFVACAIQAHPGLTAMQMKSEIEQSADLYPYFDYAYGYGVPQASFFVGQPTPETPTFQILDEGVSIFIYPTKSNREGDLFLNAQYKANRQLERYAQLRLSKIDSNKYIAIHKSCLTDRILNVCYEGYATSYTLSEEDNKFWNDSTPHEPFSYSVIDTAGFSDWGFDEIVNRTPASNRVRETRESNFYFMIGDNFSISNAEQSTRPWSPSTHLGFRRIYCITKAYRLGWGLEWSHYNYNFDASTANDLDQQLLTHNSDATSKQVYSNGIRLEFFQRVRFVPGGLTGRGLHWDLGIYGSRDRYSYAVDYTTNNETRTFSPLPAMDSCRWNWGLSTRISYSSLGIFANYRMSRLSNPESILLPRLEIGLQLAF